MKIKVAIQGSTPLILNKFSDAAAMRASSGSTTTSSASDRGSPQEIAETKLYLGVNGKPMLPQPNLLRCLIEGGRFHKAGRSAITTQRGSMLFSCFDIEGSEIPILHKEPWSVDTRAVRIPATGGRILTHRPLFHEWRLEFIADLDISIVGAKLLRQIVDDAGKRIGLGDFRPSCKGPYGKFLVVRWDEIAEQKPNKAAMKVAAE